jgi:hypothetical protein
MNANDYTLLSLTNQVNKGFALFLRRFIENRFNYGNFMP